VTSGIRLGTPAVTTRGMKPEHMDALGDLIASALKDREKESVLSEVRDKVRGLLAGFPLYPELD
jgi:glycine hydroxymethyltransferase